MELDWDNFGNAIYFELISFEGDLRVIFADLDAIRMKPKMSSGFSLLTTYLSLARGKIVDSSVCLDVIVSATVKEDQVRIVADVSREDGPVLAEYESDLILSPEDLDKERTRIISFVNGQKELVVNALKNCPPQ